MDDSDAKEKNYRLNALQVVGDWSVHDDGDGRLFYYDRKANLSQWEVPGDLAALETECMMKLMLQNAVARSNVWTAHDAGNGTLYYFNSKTRLSVWERPREWNEAKTVGESEADVKVQKERQNETGVKKEKEDAVKKRKKNKRHEGEREKAAGEKQLEAKEDDHVQEEDLPLTEEEVRAEEERKAQEHKRNEQFRAMLRDKNIMPLCKWSVALPQIAGDPRFMGVPTMDERRALFENFVKHRREDLKVEKKSKLKQAKRLFAELLNEQFQLDTWEPSTTLSVFLSTLETHVDAERYKQIQANALALLTLSSQEKIYTKAVADYNSEALKKDGEQFRLMNFLEKGLLPQDRKTLQWESVEVQDLIREFYSNASSSGESPALLSKVQQKHVFDELVARGCSSTRIKTEFQSSPKRRARIKENKQSEASLQRESRHSQHDRGRSRSRRLQNRSISRSQSRERDRSYQRRKSSRRRSSSSSRSSSPKKSSSRRTYRRRRHSYSSSRSRSRTRY